MKNSLFLFFIFLTAFAKAILGQPQHIQTPLELIEDKQSKRWNMYVQNHTDTTYEAFLMVQGEGFRRSANRPIIKKIPPNSTILMMTLIPLKGITPTYTKTFTYEEQLQTITKRKGANLEPHVNLLPIDPEQLTVFTEKDCEKCEHLIHYLTKNRIKHRLLDIKKNSSIFDLMWSHLKDSVSGGVVIKLPVIMRQEKMYFDIFNMEHFIQNFDWKKIE